MKPLFITDLCGEQIEITDIDQAIEQCVMCADSPFRMTSGYTVGEYHSDMFIKLSKLKRNERR